MSGNDLPDDIRFYRLYVTPNEHINTQISTGIKRNYILLALHNESNISVSSTDFCAPYFDYQVIGSPENSSIQFIQQLLDHFQQQYADTTGDVKKEFLEHRLQQDLIAFADTTIFLHAALFAFLETDIETHYAKFGQLYQAFADRYSSRFPNSAYAQQIEEKLLVLSLKHDVQKGHSRNTFIYILLLALACSVAGNIYFLIRKRKNTSLPSPENNLISGQQLIKELTIKEREILLLIDQGLSNKEIADKLNVEVSTIKTHVSRIYQKVNIKNRKEVREIAQYLH